MEWFILLFQPCLSRILKTEYIDSLYAEREFASVGLGSTRKVWLSRRYTKSSGVTYVCRAIRSVPAAERVIATAPRGCRGAVCCSPGCSQGGGSSPAVPKHGWHASGIVPGSAVRTDTPKDPWGGKLSCCLMEGISLSTFFLGCELWVVCLGFLKSCLWNKYL